MADQDMLHTAEVMRAALPYLDAGIKPQVELVAKLFELLGIVKSLSSPLNVAVCGFDDSSFDMEGLLTGIRPVCNNREREFIDRILNFFSMKKMFEMYNNIMSTMKNMQDFGGFPFGDSGPAADTDTVKGNFSGFNFDSIFGNSASASNRQASEKDTNENINENSPGSDSHHPFDKAESTQPEDNGFGKEAASDSVSSGNSSGQTNNPMFEMLKNMIPPEQVSTFENLSMLLNSMSYDNSSKTGNDKEHSDG